MKQNNRMQNFWSKFGRKKDVPATVESPEINGWKDKALMDFKAWLDDLPEDGIPAQGGSAERGSPDHVPMDACDLYTLLTEFTALRQEIKLQTREQNNAIRIHGDLVDGAREYAALFRDRTQHLENLEERIRLACEVRTCEHFFDIRDALTRGREAVRAALDSGVYFRRASRRRIEGVLEGYEMALRRFDRILIKFGITPVVAMGQPFNPAFMRAVGKRNDPKKETGCILEEHLCGFVKGEEILRIAEVVVNNKADSR